MNQKILFLIGGGLLLLAFVVATVLYKNQETTLQSASVGQNQGIAQREGAPYKGPADAKVTIVEFFDPACGTCRDFYPLVNQFVDQYPGKVKVVLRYAPLHPGSDQVVLMLEAAHRQGKFWEALELLFKTQHSWIINHQSQPMSAWNILGQLNLDQQKLNSDMNNPEVIKVVQQDIRDAQALNVRATPEFFVNGRPMPSFGYEQLAQLVREAMAEAY